MFRKFVAGIAMLGMLLSVTACGVGSVQNGGGSSSSQSTVKKAPVQTIDTDYFDKVDVPEHEVTYKDDSGKTQTWALKVKGVKYVVPTSSQRSVPEGLLFLLIDATNRDDATHNGSEISDLIHPNYDTVLGTMFDVTVIDHNAQEFLDKHHFSSAYNTTFKAKETKSVVITGQVSANQTSITLYYGSDGFISIEEAEQKGMPQEEIPVTAVNDSDLEANLQELNS